MGLFSRKPKVIREIHDAAWGVLVADHGVDVDTLGRDVRCVEKEGLVDGHKVTLMRVFKLSEAQKKGVEVTGWETFDKHPELIQFEGYITANNQAHLERKAAQA